MIDRLKYMAKFQTRLLILAVAFDTLAVLAIIMWVMS